MTKDSALSEIEILPGVMPATDATASDIPCWASTYHVRFDPTTGRIRKLGGWTANTFDYDAEISGVIRTVYSATINQKVYTILGTQSYLYSLIGSQLVNITPLDTTAIPAANSLATLYGTLSNNPITTVDGSNSVAITDTSSSKFQAGDIYTLSGATTTNGVPNTDLNASHIVRSIGVNTITIQVATSATSSGSGGGGSVVRSSGIITLTSAAHGNLDGDRIKIAGAGNTGGILAAAINLEFIIRNVTNNTFDFVTASTATSSVSAAGGAGTEYYEQIAGGALNQGLGQGYGAGLYGVGLYGTALTSSSGETYPRIWFCDRFGDNIVMTAGNNTGAYVWGGSTDTAPALISGAPTDINYLFVSNNILVTFGHDVENKIFASDQGNLTQWTASSTNQVFEDIIEGAGRFISHAATDGSNLIYTEQQTYTFKYIGGTAVWEIQQLDASIGLIAPMARVSINGIAYWMGQDNFYFYRGGKIETMPSNFGLESSVLRYVFDNLNYSQRYKICMGYNEKFDEIWIHYPSQNSNENDTCIRYNRKLQCWAFDDMARSAWEYPLVNLSNPRLANGAILYTHESGANDDGSPMAWSATTKKFISGKDTSVNTQIIPDSTMTGTINFGLRAYNYPQSATPMNNLTFQVTSTTQRIPAQANGRYYDYTFSGEELNQTFLMGQWFTEPQKGATAP
jgi:hypothetical protein